MSHAARSALLTSTRTAPPVSVTPDTDVLAKTLSQPHDVIPNPSIVMVKETNELELSGRGIVTLTNFEDFTNVHSLWLNDNKIEDIKHVDHCTALKQLRLHNNMITSVKGCFRKTKYLEVLSLANNKIRDLGLTLGQLNHLRYLKILDLSGNPLCEELNYRIRVITEFPSLNVLDNHEIKLSEREAAEALKPAPMKHGNPLAKPPHLPFQRSGPRGSPFVNHKPPLFSDLDDEAKYLKTRNLLFDSATNGDLVGLKLALKNAPKLNQRQYHLSVNSLHPRSKISALYLATRAGASSCVEFLTASKADIGFRCPETGNSCLHIAAENNRLEILKHLIASKGNLTDKNKKGHIPRAVASLAENTDCEKILAAAEKVVIFDKNGPPMYNFTSNSFWHDNLILPKLKERFSDFDDASNNTIQREDISEVLDTVMLKVKPDQKSLSRVLESVGSVQGDQKTISFDEFIKALKDCRWVENDLSTRQAWAQELYEQARRLMERGSKSEKARVKAMDLSNYAAFLEH